MSSDSTPRPASIKAGGHVKESAEMAEIDREISKLMKRRARAEASLVKKAAVAEQQPRTAKSKPKQKRAKRDFPLGVHKGTGYWCKKVRGKLFYFGKVADDPKGQTALQTWLEQKDDLLAGREPRAKTEGMTVAGLANQFLTHKEQMRENGELSPRT